MKHAFRVLSPMKQYSTSVVRINRDSFDQEIIWRVVHGFYSKKMYPTLSAVLERVKKDGIFQEAGSVCGDFYIVWDSPTKRQTVNNAT